MGFTDQEITKVIFKKKFLNLDRIEYLKKATKEQVESEMK